MAKKTNNAEAFDIYYTKLFGPRWESLKKALLSEAYSVKIQFSENLEPYFMDAGSIFAAASLPLDEATTVLDLCAAPGGKTLVLSAFSATHAQILANELSMQRRERLLNVLKQSLPPELREKIRVTPYDGSLLYKKNLAYFDAILCDVPCSSERHVLSSTKHIREWTQGRIKNLSYTQSSLISSAFLMLKPGGSLLYATCALTASENDKVIEKLLKKNRDASVLDVDIEQIKNKISAQFKISFAIQPEKTEYGYHILPDTSNGAGPLYISLIQKQIKT